MRYAELPEINVGPSPCEEHICPSRRRCAAKLLACDAFWSYVHKGRAIDPRISKATRGNVGEIKPTREIYENIYGANNEQV